MPEILIIPEGEIEVPSCSEIIATPSYIYLDISSEEREKYSLKDLGTAWEERKTSKRIIGVNGTPEDCGPFVCIDDTLFLANDETALDKIEGTAILAQTKTRDFAGIPGECLIYGVETDGTHLYVEVDRGGRESDRRQRTHILTTDLQTIASFASDSSDSFSGNGYLFRETGNSDAYEYEQFQQGILVHTFTFKEIGPKDDRIEAELSGCCPLGLDYPVEVFTDSQNIYSLTKQGELWHIHPNGNKQIRRRKIETDERYGAIHNNQYALLFIGKRAIALSEGRLLGITPYFEGTEKVEGLSYVNDELYVLLERKIKRYRVRITK